MSKTPEGEVKAAVQAILDEYGPRCRYIMPVASEFNEQGVSDFIGVLDGLYFAIEAKRDGSLITRGPNKGKPKYPATTAQKLFLADVRRAGGLALIIHADNIGTLRDRLDSWVAARRHLQVT